MNTVHFDTTRATSAVRMMVETLGSSGVFNLAASKDTATHRVLVSVQHVLFGDHLGERGRGEFIPSGQDGLINIRDNMSEETTMATFLHETMHLLQMMEGTLDELVSRGVNQTWAEREVEHDACNRALTLAERNDWLGLLPRLRADCRALR